MNPVKHKAKLKIVITKHCAECHKRSTTYLCKECMSKRAKPQPKPKSECGHIHIQDNICRDCGEHFIYGEKPKSECVPDRACMKGSKMCSDCEQGGKPKPEEVLTATEVQAYEDHKQYMALIGRLRDYKEALEIISGLGVWKTNNATAEKMREIATKALENDK